MLRRRARDARRAANPELALELLQEGLQQHPDDPHLAVAAASAAAKLGRADLAMQIISPVLQLQPNNPHVLTAAAAAHRAKGDLSSARRCYQAAAAAAPTNEVVLQAWGVLEAHAGRADAARALFKQAVAVRRQHMPAYVAWAALERQCGRVQDARAIHRQAHDINPASVPNLHVRCHRQGLSQSRRSLLVVLLQSSPHGHCLQGPLLCGRSVAAYSFCRSFAADWWLGRAPLLLLLLCLEATAAASRLTLSP